MGKIDAEQLKIKVRAATAEVQQQVKRSKNELDASRRLIPTSITQKDRTKLQTNLTKTITAGRRLAFFTDVVDDLNRLRDGAQFLASQAAADRAREKTVPPDYADSFRRICCAADALRLQSLLDIKNKFIVGMYGRPPVDALSQRSGLEAAEQQALADDVPTEEEVHEAYVKVARENPTLAESLEALCGFPLREEAGLPTAPPEFCPPSGARLAASYGGPPPVAPASAYQPVDLAPFSRESWPSLVGQVMRAVS
jgi:hypothetical protein